MNEVFADQIDTALRRSGCTRPRVALVETSPATLYSCFAVSELAVASMRAAAQELAALENEDAVSLDHRLALLWFSMTLRPQCWKLPSSWDAIAGDYRAADGWIRLHTNAPHHRDVALSVLGCAPDREVVAAAIKGMPRMLWRKQWLPRAALRRRCAALMTGPTTPRAEPSKPNH